VPVAVPSAATVSVAVATGVESELVATTTVNEAPAGTVVGAAAVVGVAVVSDPPSSLHAANSAVATNTGVR
jgi:hypothetical protein